MREKGKGYPEPKGHRLRRYLGITALTGKKEDIVSWYRSVYTGASTDYMKGGDRKSLLEVPRRIRDLIARSSEYPAKAMAMERFNYKGRAQQKIAKFMLQRNTDDDFQRRPEEMRKDGNPPSKPDPNSSQGMVTTTVVGAKEINKELAMLTKSLDNLFKTGKKKGKVNVNVKSLMTKK
jgi:hypothetical protein